MSPEVIIWNWVKSASKVATVSLMAVIVVNRFGETDNGLMIRSSFGHSRDFLRFPRGVKITCARSFAGGFDFIFRNKNYEICDNDDVKIDFSSGEGID